mgnify:CR=1 FL=1
MVATTGAVAADVQFIAGSLSHFTLADASTDASTAAYLKDAVQGIQAIATVVMIGEAAAGGWRFAIENNGATAAELQAAVRAAGGDPDVTVVDFAY